MGYEYRQLSRSGTDKVNALGLMDPVKNKKLDAYIKMSVTEETESVIFLKVWGCWDSGRYLNQYLLLCEQNYYTFSMRQAQITTESYGNYKTRHFEYEIQSPIEPQGGDELDDILEKLNEILSVWSIHLGCKRNADKTYATVSYNQPSALHEVKINEARNEYKKRTDITDQIMEYPYSGHLIYQDLMDGTYAVYNGKSYALAKESSGTLILMTGDKGDAANGFVCLPRIYGNGSVSRGVNFYKVINIDKATEIYKRKVWGQYRGIKCDVYSSYSADRKLWLKAKVSNDLTPETAMKAGFVKTERWENHEHYTYYEYMLNVDFDDPQLQVIKDKNEFSSRKINDKTKVRKETADETIERLIGYCCSMYMLKDTIRGMILGFYGYHLPDKEFSTNIETVLDVVIPTAYKRLANKYNYSSICDKEYVNRDIERNQNYLIQFITNELLNCDSHESIHGLGWVDVNNVIIPFAGNECYAAYIKLCYIEIIIKRQKKNVYPYKFDIENMLQSVRDTMEQYKSESDVPEPLYFGDKYICKDFIAFILKRFNRMLRLK